MNKTKILLINDHIHFSGGGDATFQQERRVYEEAGYDVYTFSHATAAVSNKTEKDIVHIESPSRVIQKTGKHFFNPNVFFQLKKALRQIQPDVVHLHLITKYPASIYAALKGYPVIKTLHGPSLFCATSWGCLKKDSAPCELGVGLKCWFRGCVPFKHIIPSILLHKITSHFVKKNVKLYRGPSRQICEVAQNVGFRPTKYVPLCIDPQFLREPAPVEHSSPTVVYVGSVTPHKGCEVLLYAFREILEEMPNARLVFAGKGKLLEKLKKESHEHNMEKNVDFLGFVSHEEINDIYYRGDVFVMPSIWSEQFGLVGPEALACGLPCVASNIGGIPEWLKDGQWGYLVPPRDVHQLANKILEILKNPQRAREFGQKGREYVMQEYSGEKFRKNMLALVAEFVAR